MTNQTKRKGKTKMKTYEVNDEVQFQGNGYKVVEVLSEGTLIHIKKTSAPFNSMVVPKAKLENSEAVGELLEGFKDSPTQEEADKEIQDILDFSVKPDLMYRPDDRITL